MRNAFRSLTFLFLAAAAVLAGNSCVKAGGKFAGNIRIDGSSTVAPITAAVLEEFCKENPAVKIAIAISGTGGGFKKFCAGEIDISNASRPIKDTEAQRAKENSIEYIEIPVAYDGISVAANRANVFVDKLTVEELKQIWAPESKVKLWSDVRAGWPSKPIRLYGAGTDSGTFDYFTEVINGKARACRADYTASEDDNILVTGVAGDESALGFFGYAYYAESKDKLRVIPIDGGHGAITPTMSTINDGTYSPLSRPIFIYVSRKAAERPEVQAFVRFYLEHATSLVTEVGYVPLPAEVYKLAQERFEKRISGSVFLGKDTAGKKLEEVMKGS